MDNQRVSPRTQRGLPAAPALRGAAAVALRLQYLQATEVAEGQGWRGSPVNWGVVG